MPAMLEIFKYFFAVIDEGEIELIRKFTDQAGGDETIIGIRFQHQYRS